MYSVIFNTKVSDADVKKYLSMTFLTGEEFEIVDENNLYEPLFKKDFVTFEQVGLSKQNLVFFVTLMNTIIQVLLKVKLLGLLTVLTMPLLDISVM